MGRHKKVSMDQLTKDSIRAAELGISYGQLKAREWDGQRHHKPLPLFQDKYNMYKEKTCPVCGAVFVSQLAGDRYCGEKCKKTAKLDQLGQYARAFPPQPGIVKEEGKITVLDGYLRFVHMARTLANCNEDCVALEFETYDDNCKWAAITAVKREGLQGIWYIRKEKEGLFAIRK